MTDSECTADSECTVSSAFTRREAVETAPDSSVVADSRPLIDWLSRFEPPWVDRVPTGRTPPQGAR